MNKALGQVALAFLGCALASSTLGAENGTPKVENYERRGDDWFVRDQTGYEWRICLGRIVVRFSPGTSLEAVMSTLSTRQIAPLDLLQLPGGGYRCSYDPRENPLTVLESVRRETTVTDAYLDTYLEFFSSGDPYYVKQWNLRKTRVDKAWDITAGSDAVVLALGVEPRRHVPLQPQSLRS